MAAYSVSLVSLYTYALASLHLYRLTQTTSQIPYIPSTILRRLWNLDELSPHVRDARFYIHVEDGSLAMIFVVTSA